MLEPLSLRRERTSRSRPWLSLYITVISLETLSGPPTLVSWNRIASRVRASRAHIVNCGPGTYSEAIRHRVVMEVSLHKLYRGHWSMSELPNRWNKGHQAEPQACTKQRCFSLSRCTTGHLPVVGTTAGHGHTKSRGIADSIANILIFVS